MWYESLLEKNRVPDVLIRAGIRKLLKQRLKEENKGDAEAQKRHFINLLRELKASPIAVNTLEANEQHYEVPTRFYQLCLGKHLKYSSCYFKPGVRDLDQAEHDMLELTTLRAELRDGQNVLELGCGWGSLSLFMSAKYPGSTFTVLSNSRTQKEFIDEQAEKRGIKNLKVITSDINIFSIDEQFDRVVSVEMFEHMRNYEMLLSKVSGFLKEDGKLFVHIFTHKEFAYKFEVKDETDWMSKYFFTGGIMPSDHLLLYFAKNFEIDRHWVVNGNHYAKTAEAWLQNMDSNKYEIQALFESVYGKKDSLKWWVYWRIFYMACAELWAFREGNEWFVSHYLFKKR